MSTSLRLYVWLVIAAAVVLGVAALPPYPILDWPRVLLLSALALVVGNMSFDLPYGATVSLGFALTFAGLIYAGPTGGAVVALMGAVPIEDIRSRKPLLLMVGNGAQLYLSALLAGAAAAALGGAPLQQGLPASFGVATVLAPILATTAFFVVNVFLVGTGVGLRTGMGIKETLVALQPGSYWVSLVVLGLLGYVMAYLIAMGSWAGLLLLVLPFGLTRRIFRVYLELSEAYNSTVKSLVAAIEAKDPYTRGHSERVAVYARTLAESLRLSAADAQLVERAALLHDVGKIGVRLSTLTSPSGLTSEEFREIRCHPTIGGDLLEGVEFLSDVVPIVRHHHERVDGSGYPDALVGDDIPLLSRVLAVADSYDAMTSDRAYRPRMTEDEARDEMVRVADSQLEARLVKAFGEIERMGAAE